jgi:uncharacterized protein DUF1236
MRTTLLTSTAIALLLAITPAYAQQKGPDEKSAPQATEKNMGNDAATERKGPARGSESREQSGKGSAQTQTKEQDRKSNAQTEPKGRDTKGSAQTQPKEQGAKGRAESPAGRDAKGSAQTQSKEQGTKGRAESQTEEQRRSGTASKSEAAGERVQLSEQQRTNMHQTIRKERNVNHVDKVNFSISVGTQVPRAVRLAVLPAAVISLVPHYRDYRYFVVDDRICIVHPSSYEIVEVVESSGQMARGGERGSSGTLTLTAEEKHIIIENVEMREGSTLALGSLKEGEPVPRDARLQEFPDVVVQKVPKVRAHKYFAVEDRVAIVDPQGSKVQLMIEAKR